jgi:hypothetical protein
MDETGLPTTLIELCDYIVKYADGIFIREKNEEGHWESIALTELPTLLAIKHTLRFVREGRIPVRVRSEAEMKELSPPEAMHGAADEFGGSDYNDPFPKPRGE